MDDEDAEEGEREGCVSYQSMYSDVFVLYVVVV